MKYQLLLFLLSLSLYGVSQSRQQIEEEKFDKWIVKLDVEDMDSFISEVSSHKNPYLKNVDILSANLELATLKTVDTTLPKITDLLSHFPIHTIIPDYRLELRDRVPDDTSYPAQWSMDRIGMPDAWELTTGGTNQNGEDIVVGVLDLGFDLEHLDLQANIFRNEGEIPDDGIDNDGNGFTDDYLGPNTHTFDGNHFIDDHGTLVSGIIGAEGDNGEGVAGINWNVKILPVSGVDSVSKIIVGMEYLIEMKRSYIETNGSEGANVVVTNLSSGLKRRFPNSAMVWCDLYNTAGELGILSVSAAPNENFDVDIEGDLPSLCASEYLITVTNTNQTDTRARLSGYGAQSIDLGAPGVDIFSTDLGSTYDEISGTSASTPHVSGLIALLHSLDCVRLGELVDDSPSASAILLRDAILQSVSVTNESLSQTVTGGRLDALEAAISITEWCSGNSIESLELLEVSSSNESLDLRFTTDIFTSHTIILSDLQGKTILTEEFIPNVFNDFFTSLDLSNYYLPTGIYILTILNENSIASKKIFHLE